MTIYRNGAFLGLGTILLASILFYLNAQRLSQAKEVDIPLETLPMTIGDWEGQDTAGLSVRSLDILKLDRFVKRRYTKGDTSIILYIGYWKAQSGEYQAAKHSPELCLPSNGWQIDRLGTYQLNLPGADSNSIYLKRIRGEYRDRSHLFYYWFFTGTRSYAEEWRALLNISLEKMFYGRSDGGIIELSVPLSGSLSKEDAEKKAQKEIEEFIAELQPELNRLIQPVT